MISGGVILDPISGRPSGAEVPQMVIPPMVAEWLRLSALYGDDGPKMMADSRISDLGGVTSLAPGDDFVVAVSGASNKIAFSDLKKLLAGYEINYTAKTSDTSVASTTEASGTTLLSPGVITFDGGPVIVEFWAPEIQTPTNGVDAAVVVSLFEGSTQITRLAVAFTENTTSRRTVPVAGRYRFTPSAGSHTYTLTAHATSLTGSPTVRGGAGGTGGYPPTFVRFVKA